MANEYEGGSGSVETYGSDPSTPDPTPAPPPPPPPTSPPRGGSNYSTSSGAGSASSTPTQSGPLAGLPQYRVAQIQDLVNQFEQLVGYSATVSDQMEANMVNDYNIADIYDVAQYLKGNLGSAWGNLAQQPWAWYGMSATEYNTKLSSFRSVWSQLTGTDLPSNDGNGNLIDQAMKQYQGTMTESQFQQWLLSNDTIKNTYGWLKYGLNFDQFQQQKLNMNFAFGRSLSDTEGVAQLQYLHSATGPSMSIANQPTFTQQERKQANVGISGSVVR